MFGRQFEGREGRFGDRDERHERHCAGRHGRGMHRGFGRHRFGGRHGGDDEMMHAGRMLAQGDLRLIALRLIEGQPRHGYDIIKALEDTTSGWYSPSPGIVYPTLTYLEEVGYLTSQPEGAKKLYTITDEGRAHLAENKDLVDAVMKRLTFIGEKAARMRERMESEQDGERGGRWQLVRAAFDSMREAARERLKNDPDAEAKVVEILARAANEIRKLQ
ncbi:PadR family transcriptional regulator [Pseudolabrys taiwanensis]|uniref:PadR family transcriptional regulator n=2 Tax=Pseudolabrys taiwanensis TaxID=331696 RepID=A0A345ZWL6_9HYPH|nr:PadR family transcriptional regulator [Pseudolabrys taiwanensis]